MGGCEKALLLCWNDPLFAGEGFHDHQFAELEILNLCFGQFEVLEKTEVVRARQGFQKPFLKKVIGQQFIQLVWSSLGQVLLNLLLQMTTEIRDEIGKLGLFGDYCADCVIS